MPTQKGESLPGLRRRLKAVAAQAIATADNIMADAGRGMEIDVVWFGD